jgi:hypothetical protein
MEAGRPPVNHPVFGNAVLEREMMPHEMLGVVASKIEPILRLYLAAIKSDEDQRLIEVIFTMCESA